jgi:hypothetical protein
VYQPECFKYPLCCRLFGQLLALAASLTQKSVLKKYLAGKDRFVIRTLLSGLPVYRDFRFVLL